MQHRCYIFADSGREGSSITLQRISKLCGKAPSLRTERFLTRIEHYNDPDAPKPNSLKPAASAIVVDSEGRILLHQRSDNGLWSIPGGGMEPGESIAETAVREVQEETGLEVQPEYLVGIYSNPRHVVAYPDGEVRQQFSVCFACRTVGGSLATSNESLKVGFYTIDEIKQMPMHESIRLRIRNYFEHRDQPAIG